ncbi:hypothetical protein D3C76_1306120 [compost metagenome]
MCFKQQDHVVESLGLGLADLDQFVEVTTCEEGVLGRGDDHTGNRVLFSLQTGDAGGHGLTVHRVHGVGTLARHVQGQDDDPVLAGFVTDGIGHEKVFLEVEAQRRSMTVAMPMPPPTQRVAKP